MATQLEPPRVPYEFLVELLPMEPVSETLATLRYSETGFTTGENDSPADWHYEGRVTNVSFKRNITNEAQVVGGEVKFSLSAIVLDNLDDHFCPYLKYSWKGREAKIKYAAKNECIENFTTLTFIIKSIVYEKENFKVNLSTGITGLDLHFERSKYAGTSSGLTKGIEGPSEFEDKFRPLVIGERRRVPCIPIQTNYFVYQVNDGESNAITKVEDGDNELTFQSGTYGSVTAFFDTAVTAGNYITHLPESLIKVGDAPQKELTATVQGKKYGSPAAYRVQVADLAQTLLEEYAGVTNVSSTSISTLNTAIGYDAGIHIPFDDAGSVSAALSTLLRPLVVWYGRDLSGDFVLNRFAKPTGTATYEILDSDIDELRILRITEPIKHVDFSYNPNSSPSGNPDQKDSDLTKIADNAAKNSIAANTVTVSESAIDSTVWLQQDPVAVLETWLLSETDADAAAAYRLALWDEVRVVAQVTTSVDFMGIELGSEIRLKHGKFGDDYWYSRLLGIDRDSRTGRFVVSLWG